MSRLEPRDLMLCHDGSLEGFFSCVFEAYVLHSYPQDICAERLAMPRLGQEVRTVQTDRCHAQRVRAGLVKRAGARVFRQVMTAFLSDEPGREMALFGYIVRAMERGSIVSSELSVPCVAETRRLVISVMNERERVFQFLRFEEVEGGVFLARIAPKANVIPISMGHFVERFNTQPFIIYDESHRLAGTWDGKRRSLVLAEGLSMPEKTQDEQRYQHLWKVFYDSISNEQRYNPELRVSLMPKRFWANMPEMRAALRW